MLWSTIIGLLKKVSANIGADLAVLFMYSLSAVLLFALFRIPNLKQIPRTYLYGAKVISITKPEDLGRLQLSKSL
ncbi:hypothetical protein [Acinetobacter sp. SwsAc6]|uniref:hypothetical protein n=1 Tax=Acinetobacter sp. SwsAc6 TaxID=2749439 RepID=UPI0021162573|nr:hypothetical protein [Acinetobacter sp. SwsAc6]